MQFNRQSRRVIVDLPVTLTTVLDSLEGTIIDLTEYGAQIVGCGLPAGTRFQIDYMGQTVFALCRWSEVDRMGVKFSFPLTEGPLFDRLAVARAKLPQIGGTPAPVASSEFSAAPRGFGRAGQTGGFGRRIG